MKRYNLYEDKFLRDNYPNGNTKEIAKHLNRSVYSVCGRVSYLGIKKSKSFFKQGQVRLLEIGSKYRFKKGSTPHNKGKKQTDYMSEYKIEKLRLTMFKKGCKPHNAKEDWEEIKRKDKEGVYHWYIKVPQEKGIIRKSRWLWEKHNGKVSENHVICFKDGSPLNCNIENLECISKGEHLRRNRYNTMNTWDKEQSKRAIIKQIKENKKQWQRTN